MTASATGPDRGSPGQCPAVEPKPMAPAIGRPAVWALRDVGPVTGESKASQRRKALSSVNPAESLNISASASRSRSLNARAGARTRSNENLSTTRLERDPAENMLVPSKTHDSPHDSPTLARESYDADRIRSERRKAAKAQRYREANLKLYRDAWRTWDMIGAGWEHDAAPVNVGFVPVAARSLWAQLTPEERAEWRAEQPEAAAEAERETALVPGVSPTRRRVPSQPAWGVPPLHMGDDARKGGAR